MEQGNVAQRYNEICERVKKASALRGASASFVHLVAVSKTYDEDHIEPVLEAGQRVFGENRVQESLAKWPSLKEKFEGIELHLIGPLQSNKAKEAVGLFDVIQTVDRDKIAKAIARECERQEKVLPIFIQVNVGDESQKAGIACDDVDAFVERCQNEYGLNVIGLMCIPPMGEVAEPYFKLLSDIAKRNGLQQLSMGMSADYELAIACGATYVRVGSALFGARASV